MSTLDQILEYNDEIDSSIKNYINLINKENELENIRENKIDQISCIYCDNLDIEIQNNNTIYCSKCQKMSINIIEDKISNFYDLNYSTRRYNNLSKEQILANKEKDLQNKFHNLNISNDENIINDSIKYLMALQKVQHRKSNVYINIQAAIVYLTYISYGEVRSIKVICKIFGISNISFNEGYKIVIQAINNNIITFKNQEKNKEKNIYKLYIRYYLSIFVNLSPQDLEKYYNFCCDIITLCLEKNLGYKSNIITKVCGVIYYIIQKYHSNVDLVKLNEIFECKLQTYKKFYDVLIENEKTENFKVVYEKYNMNI
jgi:hypothetical protein